MDNTIQDYKQFLSDQDTINDNCREFIILYSLDRRMPDSIKQDMIRDYIREDMYNRYNEIESFIHQHPLFTPG